MIISIDYIKDSGNIEKERIVFDVIEDGQIGKYLIAESETLNDSKFSSLIKNTYWFPDQEVKTGDRVILYTKEGRKNIVDNEDGSNSYFFYWGLKSPHLKSDNDCVVLFETSWTISVIPKQEA